MKLFEVLKYETDDKNREVFTYKAAPKKGDVPPDDIYFKNMSASRNSGHDKVPVFKSDNISHQQHQELQQMKTDGVKFQPVIPFAWGSTILGTQGAAATFLDAIKDRDPKNVTFKGMDLFIKDLAAAAVLELKKAVPVKNYKTIVVTPMPSTNALAKRFATAVAKDLQATTGQPVSLDNLFIKNPDLKIGTIQRSKHQDPTKPRDEHGFSSSRKLVASKNAYDLKYSKALNGTAADVEKAIDAAVQRQKEVEQYIESDEIDENYGQALLQEMDLLETHLNKLLKLDPANAKATSVIHQTKLEYQEMRSLVYNRMKMNPDAVHKAGGDQKTLIVIADDNFQRRRTVQDAYFTLAENGVASYPTQVVAAIAMHQMRAKSKWGETAAKEDEDDEVNTG